MNFRILVGWIWRNSKEDCSQVLRRSRMVERDTGQVQGGFLPRRAAAVHPEPGSQSQL